MSPKSTAQPGLNLLALRPVRALVLWPGFPYVFQAAVLIIFVCSLCHKQSYNQQLD